MYAAGSETPVTRSGPYICPIEKKIYLAEHQQFCRSNLAEHQKVGELSTFAQNVRKAIPQQHRILQILYWKKR